MSIYVSGGNIIERLVVVIQFFFRITYVTLRKFKTLLEYNIHGPVHHESTVNNCPTRCEYVQFIIFLQTPLHVSGGYSTHHQEHI
jgi:hypothetical protein